MTHRIIQGDCREAMREMPAESVHSIVTDPPYGWEFMCSGWDKSVPGVEFWTEALRVAKLGAHLLAFGGTRTFHRLTCAIEDAGWEIRDCIMWVYGSGFPKSLDVSKAIDKEAGAEREVVGVSRRDAESKSSHGFERSRELEFNITAPATAAASQWSGWGTALKPAWEPIIVARKPLIGTVAANVQQHGTGAINVDGCRVPTDDCRDRIGCGSKGGIGCYGDSGTYDSIGSPLGRWPANLIHDGSEEVTRLFPNTAPSKSTPRNNGEFKSVAKGRDLPHVTHGHDDNGGSAARFFYCAKASKRDRDEGLDATRTVKYQLRLKGGPECQDAHTELAQLLRKATSGLAVKWLIGECGESITGLCPTGSLSTTLTEISKITTSGICALLTPLLTSVFTVDANCGVECGGNPVESAESSSASSPTSIKEVPAESVRGVSSAVSKMLSHLSDEGNWTPTRNVHSTVKPTDLMRYLCRLVTPPGGIVLDPFCGSGSTGKAAVLEGFEFIGCELNHEYVEIANARIKNIGRSQQPDLFRVDLVEKAKKIEGLQKEKPPQN